MRRKQNEIICEKSRAFEIKKDRMWETGGTILYSIKLEETRFKKKMQFGDYIILGIFETEKERDLWFSEWQKKLKAYEKNMLSEF